MATIGNTWSLMSEILHGRRVQNRAQKGTVIFGPFIDPDDNWHSACAVRWDGEEEVEHFRTEILRGLLLDEFDEKFLPPVLAKYQKQGWVLPLEHGNGEEEAFLATEPPKDEDQPSLKHKSGKKRARDSSGKVPKSRARDASEDDGGPSGSAEDVVIGWTGCPYPRALCVVPGDKKAGDIPAEEMEGEFDVERIMDEIKDAKGKKWVLVKWKGYELRPGSNGNLDPLSADKGDWEPITNLGNVEALKKWKREKPAWWMAHIKKQ